MTNKQKWMAWVKEQDFGDLEQMDKRNLVFKGKEIREWLIQVRRFAAEAGYDQGYHDAIKELTDPNYKGKHKI